MSRTEAMVKKPNRSAVKTEKKTHRPSKHPAPAHHNGNGNGHPSGNGHQDPAANGRASLLAEKVKELLRLAQEQGYLTYSDINDALQGIAA